METHPAWRATRRAALDAWRAGLSEAERAEHDAAIAAAKASAGERRAARRARATARADLDRRVLALALRGGATTDEIAAALEISSRAVSRSLERFGVESAGPCRRRIPCGIVSVAARAELEKIAAERGASLAQAIETLVEYALADKGFRARQILRIKAAPTRGAA